MATSKKPPSKADRVAKARVTRRKQTLASQARNISGMAEARSKLVADGYASGTRKVPPEDLELPANATPLDVLVMAMRRAYMLGGSLFAAPYAEKAAPYLHGKISSIELKNPGSGGEGGAAVPFKVEFVDP